MTARVDPALVDRLSRAVQEALVEQATARARSGRSALTRAGQEALADSVLREQLQSRLDTEVRATVLGHVQRGGVPTAFDRVLATLYGNAAAELVREPRFDCMVALQRGELACVALDTVAGRVRQVPLDHPLLRCAEQIGINLGR